MLPFSAKSIAKPTFIEINFSQMPRQLTFSVVGVVFKSFAESFEGLHQANSLRHLQILKSLAILMTLSYGFTHCQIVNMMKLKTKGRK